MLGCAHQEKVEGIVEQITVMKVGGNELDDPAFLERLCVVLAAWTSPLILVHGGGKEITAALERYGQSSSFVEGLRVTPPESMAVMEMVVCGSVNKRIVARLSAQGRPALGLSGVDLGVLRCVPHRPGGVDLGRVGAITLVDAAMLQAMVKLGWLPVLAPVALGQTDGLSYNVNADHVAQAVAAALTNTATNDGLTELVFVSNVPGVLFEGQVVAQLTAPEIEQGIQSGAISGGMIPKVRAALSALEAGVAAVRITNLDGLDRSGTFITMHGRVRPPA
jgi:acetylglutamate kinase